jgi:hypothetical protein
MYQLNLFVILDSESLLLLYIAAYICLDTPAFGLLLFTALFFDDLDSNSDF